MYDGLGRLTDALYLARPAPWYNWTYEVGAYDEKNITYDANGNIKALKRYTQQAANSPVELIDDLFMDYGSPTATWWGGPANSGNRLLGAYDYQSDNRGFKNSTTTGWNSYTYDANGSMTHDGNKGVDYVYNTLNKVARQTVASGNIAWTYDASGTVLRKVTTTTTVKTETYIDGFVYESSASFSQAAAALRAVPTPEGRAVVVQPTDARFTYEYHLRDHLGNLRVAFRAQAGTEDLKLSSELSEREGDYPQFANLVASRSNDAAALPAREGSYVAAVTNSDGGPAVAIPVSHQDHLKVRVYYKTPNGVQYYRPAAAPTLSTGVAMAWAVAPTLLVSPVRAERSAPVAPGIQVSVAGLLSHWFAQPKQPTAHVAGVANAGTGTLNAYLQWTLTALDGHVLRTGTVLAPVTAKSRIAWTRLDLALDLDLSSEDTRTGTLRLQEVNDGSQPVYFDSLTVTHPQDQALVSQENHYYPFGMALSGVAVNTTAQPQVSKDQFNGGSELQDELLGSEQGIYSTFYRNYDPATGRFQGVDPMADNYASDSPYSFGFNDPINFNDPNGDDPIRLSDELYNLCMSLFAHTDPGGSAYWTPGLGAAYATAEQTSFIYGLGGGSATYSGYTDANSSVSAHSVSLNWNVTVTGRNPNSGFKVEAPGFGESLIPIWGSGKQAIHDYQNGDYGWAAFNAALAISDVFLVKSIITGIAKGGVKMLLKNPRTWRESRRLYGQSGFAMPRQQLHHWLLRRNGQTAGTGALWWAKNQMWNLMPMKSQAFHTAVHGWGPNAYNALERVWFGTPTWFKAGTFSGFGKSVNAYGNDDEQEDGE